MMDQEELEEIVHVLLDMMPNEHQRQRNCRHYDQFYHPEETGQSLADYQR
jgi:hypothetical protein